MSNVRFRPSSNAAYFYPTQRYTLSAGGSQSKDFFVDGREFGFNRISIGTNTPSTLLVSARLNDEVDIFKNVHASALQDLFRMRSLLAPIVIPAGSRLTITVTNTDTVAAAAATIQLLGYDQRVLAEWREFNAANGRNPSEPVLITGYASVPAQASLYQIQLTQRARPIGIHRIMVGSNGPADLLLNLEYFNNTIKRQVYPAQVNEEFLAMPALVPIVLEGNIPLDLLVSNANPTTPRHVSIIAEGYYR